MGHMTCGLHCDHKGVGLNWVQRCRARDEPLETLLDSHREQEAYAIVPKFVRVCF